ncbi:MAG: DedA family protein [Actinomycetota bacterium]
MTELLDLINEVVAYLETLSSTPWYYLVIGAIAFLDSVFPVVPSETTVILGGIAAGQNKLSIFLVILIGALGAYAGDSFSYFLGNRTGPYVQRWIFRGEQGQARLERAGEQIRRRGGLLLITARFIPGGRTALTFTCGVTRQPFLQWFTRWDLLAVFVWASYAGLLGFFFGERFEDDHTRAFWWAFGTALSVTALIEVVRYVRGRLRGQPDQEAQADGNAEADGNAQAHDKAEVDDDGPPDGDAPTDDLVEPVSDEARSPEDDSAAGGVARR